ncbi:MAG TPA: hypothetical protein VL334_05295 [Anaerolineae bacterium]|jgi:hypothetical protein|nr:hypothetical protein [Anaerolineae bacterium]
MAASFVTIPNTRVQLTIDQLVAAVRQMDPGERAKIARALTDVELDQELAQLISELYSQPPVTEISDADIVAEVRTVRQQVH